MEITTVYQKERHEFGRATNTFAMSDVVILDDGELEVVAEGSRLSSTVWAPALWACITKPAAG